MQEEAVQKQEGEKEGEKVFSHSRLWLFESCPEAYKIKYIDKTFPELPKSIELFLGDKVHESLEWLYTEMKKNKKIELDELIINFADSWKKSLLLSEIRLNGADPNFYFNKGIKFLIDYYKKNFPFSDDTIEIEKHIFFPLDNFEKYYIQGYIDRIVRVSDKEYEVHDYKTNYTIKTQSQVDLDRQLGFYHIGLQKLFGEQITVRLIWHFLAHNKTLVSARNQTELDKLKKDTLELINKIEETKEWHACGRKWCDWCDYKRKNGLNNWIKKDNNLGTYA